MVHSSESPPGTYLPTGWRIVGQGAERLAERLASGGADGLVPGEAEQALYGVQCTFDPVTRGRPTVERVLDAVTEQIRAVDSDCPRLVRDQPVERPSSRFSGLRFEQFSDAGREWIGELIWRAVHPVVAGAPITSHLVIEETSTFTRLTVRVTADHGLSSVRGYVGAGQAQPAFLRALRPDLTPIWLGGPLKAHVIQRHGVLDLVHSILAASNRDVPVAVLAPLEAGGFVVDPEDLAWDLLGRARLYVLTEHRQTFDLSDVVGDRRMSCYWGAVRCYFPGWSRHDDPYEHPLLVGERLADPILRATWLGEVGLPMGRRIEFPSSVRERRPPPDIEVRTSESTGAAADLPNDRDGSGGPDVPNGLGVRDRSGDAAPISLAEPEGDVAPTVDREDSAVDRTDPARAALSLSLDELLREVRALRSSVGGLTDEVERLRTISSVRSSSTNAIERRLGRLEDILGHVFPDGSPSSGPEEEAEAGTSPPDESSDDGRTTLPQVVNDSAESHADTLVFLDSAHHSAAESPYEDPERVRAILDAMARVARRRRDGVLGTSLREAFGDLGIDYRSGIARSTPARLREQYRFAAPNGDYVEAEEHIVLGNTYDPRRCLRLYFSSRVPNEPRFVIGHVGRHFEVRSST